MLDIILLKVKKNLSLSAEEQEYIFLEAFTRFIQNTDEVAYPFIKINLEHLISGYITEEEQMSPNFIQQLSELASHTLALPVKHQADGVYFMVRYLLAKRKSTTAMRYAVLFLHQLAEDKREEIDKLTLDYLEYFATNNQTGSQPSDPNKEQFAKVYTGLEKGTSRQFLTPEFLENPFHPYFKEYNPEIHRILAMSSLAQLKKS
ncbi:hypothetical protein [Entomospira culicis]|uniref:Uncharacterized protein n=1 Tax=Entomospira culicis TaxID=2719989 RepID=A0A968GH96_9SPIO|nr:hypothetical protein [Entomospira culicis]NIZ18787.1 hypothetical protein [Entomospira culicis]NIZ69002.1 hypothetical protein [Entomospira culicis]WDI37593.1 hypothetical protein PVA46_02055 [Entomospira culicis]WDI39221.1 hypothetical protein PVA47_02060 [Entomospira culicis]